MRAMNEIPLVFLSQQSSVSSPTSAVLVRVHFPGVVAVVWVGRVVKHVHVSVLVVVAVAAVNHSVPVALFIPEVARFAANFFHLLNSPILMHKVSRSH